MSNHIQINNWLKYKLPIVFLAILSTKAFLFIGIPLSFWYVWTINKAGTSKKSKPVIVFSQRLFIYYLLVATGAILELTILLLFSTGYLIYLLFQVDDTFHK